MFPTYRHTEFQTPSFCGSLIKKQDLKGVLVGILTN
jgi:hypothetical protein